MDGERNNQAAGGAAVEEPLFTEEAEEAALPAVPLRQAEATGTSTMRRPHLRAGAQDTAAPSRRLPLLPPDRRSPDEGSLRAEGAAASAGLVYVPGESV